MNYVTPRYICLAVAYLIGAFAVGGACGGFVAMIVSIQYELFGTATMPGAVAHVIMGTGAFVGVVMFVGDRMAETESLREYKRGVQHPRGQG